MIPESPILSFEPTHGVDYLEQPSGKWWIYTREKDEALIIIRKYLDKMLTNKHTIRIVDTVYNKVIDVVNTYQSVWSAMDVIGVCLMREDAHARWIELSEGQVIVGMAFKRYKIPYGLYMVHHGKLEIITGEMGG